MSDGAPIEWTDATVNAVNGCSVLSPGCTNCYAMRLAGTRLKNHQSRKGLTIDTRAGPVWNGDVRLHEPAMLQPLRWRRPRRIFWNAHGDLFHDAVPDEWIDRCFAVMALTPQHTHQVLTKRPARMREYMLAERTDEMNSHAGTMMHWDNMPSASWPPANVWLGVSVEDQTRADERIPDLLATPAALRFLSCEPLLETIDLRNIYDRERKRLIDALTGDWQDSVYPRGDSFIAIDSRYGVGPKIGWVIGGMESGPNARPGHPDLARNLREQCREGGTPFLWKQNGVHAWVERVEGDPSTLTAYRVPKKVAGRLLDGVQHDGMPA